MKGIRTEVVDPNTYRRIATIRALLQLQAKRALPLPLPLFLPLFLPLLLPLLPLRRE
ncbi:hypothetical protein B484DRAFT_412170 [Ochromonadaceae sp. CCMP2298]|nr:hypothetical protein B484DRAFT_412170 [Ochromonadaceae sp. CCMP2298]